jgi:hypothetical protein
MVVSAAVAHRIPAGWYRDRDDRSLRRWWDGVAWTDYYSPFTLPIRLSDDPILAPAELLRAVAEVAVVESATAESAVIEARHPRNTRNTRSTRSTRSTVRRYLPLSVAATLAIANLVLTIILASGT